MTDLKPRDCTFLFRIGEVWFYEDPTYGDETTMWAWVDGGMFKTDWWDRPSPEEVADWIVQVREAVG